MKVILLSFILLLTGCAFPGYYSVGYSTGYPYNNPQPYYYNDLYFYPKPQIFITPNFGHRRWGHGGWRHH